MSTSSASHLIRFGNFEVDTRAREVKKHGRVIKLQEQPVQLLLLLLEQPGEVVTREHARKSLWEDDTFVDYDHGLGAALNRLRAALGDSAVNPRFIETLPRRGYRFIAPVTTSSSQPQEVEPAATSASPPARPAALRYGAWVLMLGVFFAAIWFLTARAPTPSTPEADTKMLLVLPFENLTGDPEQEYFTDGLTEEIIAQVGRLNLENFGVLARTSSMAYKNTRRTIGEIEEELGVSHVLEGSMRSEGGRVRITAQLISADDQSHLWVESYDRDFDGILALQSDVSEHVAAALAGRLGLSRDPVNIPQMTDSEAYEDYLKGRFYWNKRDVQGFQKAIEFFERSIALDPHFAPPYAGLADCYTLLASFDVVSPAEAQSKSRTMARTAMEIDPTLPEAYTSLGIVKHAYDWDWAGASEAYQRAIELNPSYATAYHWRALHLAGMGRFDEALDEMKRARALDPLSLIINTELGRVLYTARQYEAAADQLLQTLDLDPGFGPAHMWLSLVYLQQGRFEDSVAAAQSIATVESGGATALAVLGASYAASGRASDATGVIDNLDRLSDQRYVSPASFALVHTQLDELDEAFGWLEKAFEQRSAYLRLLNVDPIFDPLRADPRFDALLLRMNFPD